jgi:hypothetical protein
MLFARPSMCLLCYFALAVAAIDHAPMVTSLTHLFPPPFEIQRTKDLRISYPFSVDMSILNSSYEHMSHSHLPADICSNSKDKIGPVA